VRVITTASQNDLTDFELLPSNQV